MNMQTIVQILLALAPYVGPPLAALEIYLVKKAIDSLPANKRNLILPVVRTAVTAASQMASDNLNGPGKRQIALELIEKELAHYNISIPSSVLNGMIEEAVKALKIAEGAAAVTAVPMPMTESK